MTGYNVLNSSPATPRLSPMMTEWNMTPNSRIRKAEICCWKDLSAAMESMSSHESQFWTVLLVSAIFLLLLVVASMFSGGVWSCSWTIDARPVMLLASLLTPYLDST